jgi:hypothetical protein
MKNMKTTKILSVLALGALFFAQAQNQEDIKAIKAMTGCYEVSFNFAETFSPKKDYEKAKNYTSGALEWITVAEESPKKIELQHLLIVDPSGTDKNAIVKHWRQDWVYENTDLYVFDQDNKWKYKKLNPQNVKGQWTQIVYQVDDAPRYSGSGSWVHVDGRNYWESNADAPLPRREYTTRKDYNVLNRTNNQEVFDWGWVHDQDNKKVVRKDGTADEVLVEEKGREYYKKVDDGKCVLAQNYWKEYAPLWGAVRQAWDERMAQKKNLEVKPNVGDTYLYKKIWNLQPKQTKEAKELVKEYIVK